MQAMETQSASDTASDAACNQGQPSSGDGDEAAKLLYPSKALIRTDAAHIVDELIEERAQGFMRHPGLWRVMRRIIDPLLRYKTAVEMADAIADMPAREVMDFVNGLLTVKTKLIGTENIPRDGRFMLVSNHPTGIADGVAVYDALKDIRPDMCFFANRDALRVAPKLEEMIIPVEWVMDARSKAKTRDMVKRMMRAFRDENAVIMFPSGTLAQMSWKGLREKPWMSTTVNLAKRNMAPIVPLHISGRNSLMYYLFCLTNGELRDITLFNELLNKKNYPFTLTFGAPIQPEQLDGDPDEVMATLCGYVEDNLSKDAAAHFNGLAST